MECVKSKVDSMGMDNLDREALEELKAWTCVAKDVAEYDYYYHITEAMEKPENQYGVNYDENGKFYTQMRGSNGRYMSRGYEYDPTMRGEMEHYRDMDRTGGKMYYTEPSNMGNMNHSSSRYDMARRGFEEAKATHPDSENMAKMREIFEALESDLDELKPKMLPNEKVFAKNKFASMSNSMM